MKGKVGKRRHGCAGFVRTCWGASGVWLRSLRLVPALLAAIGMVSIGMGGPDGRGDDDAAVPPALASETALPTATEVADQLRSGRLSRTRIREEILPRARERLAREEQIYGSESLEVARALDLLVRSIVETTGVRDPKTIVLAERALRIKEKVLPPTHAELLPSLRNLIDLKVNFDSFSEVAPLIFRVEEISDKVPSLTRRDIAESLWRHAEGLRRLFAFDLSEPRYELALSLFEKSDGPKSLKVAYLLYDFAKLYVFYTGEPNRAWPLLERAYAIRKAILGDDHEDTAVIVNFLGILHHELGDHSRALELYERALQIRKQRLGPDDEQVGQSLNNLALVYEALGDPVRARKAYARALEIWEARFGSDNQEVGYLLGNIAGLDARMGHFERALRQYERAIHLLSFETYQRKRQATVISGYADALWAYGEASRGIDEARRALAIREEIFNAGHPVVAENLVQLARMLAATGARDEALELLHRAESILRKQLVLAARVLSERKALRLARNRTAARDLWLSVAAADHVRVLPRDRKRGAREQTRRIWDAVIRSRALVLDEMASRRRALAGIRKPEVEALVAKWKASAHGLSALLVSGPASDDSAEYANALAKARERAEEAEMLLARHSAPLRRQRARAGVGLTEVTAALPERSALVAFVRYERTVFPELPLKAANKEASGDVTKTETVPSYLAFVLRGREQRPAFVPLGPASKIDRLVSTWRVAVGTEPAPLAHDDGEYEHIGAELRQTIWDPLSDLIGDANQVLVVPDGMLNLINLAALPSGEDRYLVEVGPAIHYLSAERDMVREQDPKVAGKGLLAIGGPDFSAAPEQVVADLQQWISSQDDVQVVQAAALGSAYRGPTSGCDGFRSLVFEDLPGSRLEAGEVVRFWRSTASSSGTAAPTADLVLSGRRASEAAFRIGAPGRKALHIATHAFLVPDRCGTAASKNAGVSNDNPLFLTGLAFAGANRRYEEGASSLAGDGILTAEEIATLDLRGVEWTVLSACETALGQVWVGEGVLGLRRAFEVAGTGTLITSLWRVKDDDAREWMRRLYSARAAKTSTVEAVRRATAGVLSTRRKAGLSTHPFYWGMFVAAGDWR